MTEETSPPVMSPVDLEDLSFWSGPRSVIDDAFVTLRRDAPRSFVQEKSVDGARFGGYWSLTKFADVIDVSRRAADFCSGKGSNIVDMPPKACAHTVNRRQGVYPANGRRHRIAG
jgi:cytochrome P450